MSEPASSTPPPGHVGAIGPRASYQHRVHRFSGSERALHMVHGSSFLAMMATGFMLGLPCMVKAYGAEHRPLVLDVHLVIAALWATALSLVWIFGDRARLRHTREQFESLDADDLLWLRSKAARQAPQARFNGGQKLHAIVQAALTVILFASGIALWVELKASGFAVPGALGVHDYAMAVAVFFVVGHVGMALSPRIRTSLPSILRGTVPASYARSHHADWDESDDPREIRPPRTAGRLFVGAVALGCGVVVAVALTNV
ncbi:MAG: cytochrome b/b6 domain-containing protein [Solirubrobacteraceae bacterium]|nr:cytochrome b/b6 domain-containing protein [Solirubrobacteraceae bacterium]